MYTCPACGADDVADRTACRCGADLSLLRGIDAAPDVWFNQALEAAAAGDAAGALTWISACCVARPTDAEAWLVQAKLWAGLGHPEPARKALERAAEIDPGAAGLNELREALQPKPKSPNPPHRRRSKKQG